jgi:hypothetical protein
MMGAEKAAAGLKLIGYVDQLREIEASRLSGKLKPVQAGSLREKVLCDGIILVANYFGVMLKPIIAIDANGELPIVSQGLQAFDLVGAPFSKDFCDTITKYTKPRCGMPGTVAVMNPEHSNWCRINHFDAERMLFGVVETMVV